MPPTKAMGLRIPHDAAQWVTARARAEQRSLAFVVTALIRAEMQREAKPKKTKTAQGEAARR